MRVVVDLTRCQGYAQCAFAAPDVFAMQSGDALTYDCAPDDALRVAPGKNGIFLPTLVRGGEVVGTWRRGRERRDTISVEISPFHEGLDLEGFRAPFERWAAFWSTELGEVTAVA